jgi:hypothetical protein
MLDDATLREIAQREERLEQMRERATKDAEQAKEERKKAELERQEQNNKTTADMTPRPAPSSGGLGTFKVEVTSNGGTVSREELQRAARELAPMIIRQMELSQKTTKG